MSARTIFTGQDQRYQLQHNGGLTGQVLTYNEATRIAGWQDAPSAPAAAEESTGTMNFLQLSGPGVIENVPWYARVDTFGEPGQSYRRCTVSFDFSNSTTNFDSGTSDIESATPLPWFSAANSAPGCGVVVVTQGASASICYTSVKQDGVIRIGKVTGNFSNNALTLGSFVLNYLASN